MRPRALGLLLIPMLALAACSGDVSETPSPTPSVTTPSPTPDPVETEEPPAAFRQIMDGDCAALLPDAASYLGDGAAPRNFAPPHGVSTLGGVDCGWTAQDYNSSISVGALPDSLVSDEMRETYAAFFCDNSVDGQPCRVSETVGDIWILVTRTNIAAPGVEESDMTPVLDSVRQAVMNDAPAVPPADTAGWWSEGSCDVLANELDLAEIIGTGDYYEGWPAGGSILPMQMRAVELGTWDQCRWYPEDYRESGGVWIELFPGAHGQWDQALEARNGDPVEVSGAVAAFYSIADTPDATESVFATDGVNIVEIRESPESREQTAARVLAVLSGSS